MQQPGTELIPRSVLFGNPERSEPTISPDGTQLGYLAPVNGVLNVWIRTLGQNDDCPVTDDTSAGSTILPGNMTTSTSSTRKTPMAMRTGDSIRPTSLPDRPRNLTPFDKVQASIVAYEWHKPGMLLVQINQRDESLFDVYRLDLATGELEMDTENPGDVSGWHADNDLQVRVAQVMTADGSTVIRVREDAGAPWRELIQWGPDETFGGVLGFTPDNRRLLVATSLNANAARLLEVDIATGTQQVIAADPQFDVSGMVPEPQHSRTTGGKLHEAAAVYEFLDQCHQGGL